MKKLLSLALALALVLSLSAVAFASTELNSGKTSTEVTVSFEIEEGYTVTIPAETVSIDSNDINTVGKIGEVTASEVYIAEGSTLKVTVESTNSWYLKSGSTEVPYEMRSHSAEVSTADLGSKVDTATPILTVADGAHEANIWLGVHLTEAGKYAGEYSDTLTFKVEVTPG